MHGTIRDMGRVILFTLLATGSGCSYLHLQKQPPPPPPLVLPPPVTVSVSHFAGSPLSGPRSAPVGTVKGADAMSVRVTFVALATMPPIPSESIGSAARLIAVERGGVPVLPTPRLTGAARLANITDANAFLTRITTSSFNPSFTLDTKMGALPVGITTAFEAEERVDAPRIVAGQLVHRSVKVDIYRPPGAAPSKTSLQVALLIEDVVTPAAPADKADEPPGDDKSARGKKPATRPTAPSPPPVVQRELAILERPAGIQQDQFAVIVPFRFGESSSRVIAAVVEITPGSADAEFQKTVAAGLQDIGRSGQLAATRPYLAPLDNPDWPSYASALESLGHAGQTRPALVFLASETGAGVCEDVALVADEIAEDALAQRVLKKVSESPSIRSKDALAWVLDSAAYEVMTGQQAAGKLAPELAATLTLHAGEAGRHSGSVDEALRAAHNAQEFETRLIAENQIFLEDSSPASRVRAFDWLQAHGRAPAGYDPLGKPKERQAALERAANPPNTPASTGGAP